MAKLGDVARKILLRRDLYAALIAERIVLCARAPYWETTPLDQLNQPFVPACSVDR